MTLILSLVIFKKSHLVEMKNLFKVVLVFLLANLSATAQKQKFKVNTVAFYNVENLFDYERDESIFDEEWTPEGKNRWTEEHYNEKLKNIAKVISEIGYDETQQAPTVIGLCEVENLRVLEDLVNQPALRKYNYGIIHYDSPDRRGIDVALLYRKGIFQPTGHTSYELLIYNTLDPDKRIYTRDQLLVSGVMDGERMHFIVNHWPSRSGVEQRSRPGRLKAAELNMHIIDSLFSEDPYAKIINMGDFNDDPNNISIKEVLQAKSSREDLNMKELYNPMEAMFKKGQGTLAYRDGWNLFDQIILSSELAKKDDYSSYRLHKAGIFNKKYLQNPRGQYKGYPYRAFANGFTGGYSDHFPVYVLLIKAID